MIARSADSAARPRRRKGAAALDYVLVLGVILPLAGFVLWIGPQIMSAVYDVTCTLVSWPFM
jgi:hypothetical protein